MGLAKDFYSIVADPADPSELKVGDAVRLESPYVNKVIIVSAVWDDPIKGRQMSFRDATFEDCYYEPTITILVEEGQQ